MLDEITASYTDLSPGGFAFGKLVQYFITLLEFPSRSNWKVHFRGENNYANFNSSAVIQVVMLLVYTWESVFMIFKT